MTLRVTPEGYVFPDPDRLELDHNLVERRRMQVPVSMPAQP